jgi:ELWxxDGT repeat protein
MTTRWLLVMIPALISVSVGEPADLVVDLETEVTMYDAEPWIVGLCGGQLYFAAGDGIHGRELWRTDGTADSTVLVDDLCPGRCDGLDRWGYPRFFGSGQRCLVDASDGGAGFEPWLVAAGSAERLADVSFGPQRSQLRGGAELPDGRLVFEARPMPLSPWGQLSPVGDLWITDGTADGTRWLDGPIPTECSASFLDLVPAFGGVAYRSGENVCWTEGKAAGVELIWATSGTQPHEASGPLVTFGDDLVFDGTDAVHGRELWRSDGSQDGTRLVYDFCPGPCHGRPRADVVEDRLYVGAMDEESDLQGWTKDLWISDGAETGTHRLLAAGEGQPSNPGAAARLDGGPVLVWMRSGNGDTYELWATDGTAETTRMVAGAFWWYTDSVAVPGGRVFEAQRDGPTGLWMTDGTTDGTASFETFAGLPTEFHLTELGSQGLFVAPTSDGDAVWATDGTPAGTRIIGGAPEARASAEVRHLRSVGDRLVFVATTRANGSSLWVLEEETVSLLAAGIDPEELVVSRGLVFFRGADRDHGQELWVSDGTPGGTRMVEDLAPGRESSWPTGMTALAGGVVFSAGHARDERYVWHSDGTSVVRLTDADVNRGNHDDPLFGQCEPYPRQIRVADRKAFFAGVGATGDITLWVSDGSVGGTREVSSLPDLACELPLDEMQATAEGLVFTVGGGSQVWASDGTAAGTVVLEDFQWDAAHELTPIGSTIYFLLRDGGGADTLWRANSTSVERIHDLQTDSLGHGANLTAVGDRLFLTVFQEETGEELWVSDGTAAGTRMVRDIAPGARGSNPSGLREIDGLAVFAADDGTAGHELWRSDGSKLGTYRVTDLYPGPPPSSPEEATLLNGILYFAANDGVVGRELWSMDANRLRRWRHCDDDVCGPSGIGER